MLPNKISQRNQRNRHAIQHVAEPLEDRRMLSLTHLYNFNTNANDSVGTAHATLFNGAVVSNGRLSFQNAGLISSSSTVQYAKLPNGILPASGSASVSVWYTTFSGVPSWMRVFDFGNQTGSNGNSYLYYTPRNSSNLAAAGIRASGGTEKADTGPLSNQGYLHMASVVVNATTDTMSLYLDGALASTVSLAGVNISAVTETNAYLGRSNFNADPGFSGSIDELRIYDTALDAATIASDWATPLTRPAPFVGTAQMENLNRGLVAVNQGAGQVYVGWRLLGTDPSGVGFNLYRSTGTGAFAKLNASPLTTTTDYVDTGVDTKQVNRYYVKAVISGIEQSASETFSLGANTVAEQYIGIPLQVPAGGTTRDGVPYTYEMRDANVGDLDGDGQYEYVVNWFPVGQTGYWPSIFVDAYELDGTRLWRIDLGPNITDPIESFVVYDLDGNGKAEVSMRTSDGTVSGTGQALGDPNAFWQNAPSVYPAGWVMNGPEFLTVFSGETGAVLATTTYEPARGNVADWGDNYGQRSHGDRGTVAYLDGVHPSLVWSRGIYYPWSGYSGQNQTVAFDFNGTTITKRWHFKAGLGIYNDQNSNFVGQGNHQFSVADVDLDGKQEIITGSMIVDDDGRPLISTQLEHGDALHVSDLNPNRPGMEVFGIHENEGTYDPTRPYGAAMYDPVTGITLWGAGRGIDVGRGNAADIDPTHPGAENWGGPPMDNPTGAGVIRDVNGVTLVDSANVALTVPSSNNFLIWWDGDLTRELLDRTYINKWDWTDGSSDRLITMSGVATNQGTKQFPALSGDILGDWREEVLWRTTDNTELRIYTTTIPAQQRMYTLMHDVQYREAISWQNQGYNQPPHPSFFLGAGMSAQPHPNITTPVASISPPSAPTNVQTNIVGPDEINISWNPVTGATSYRVKRSDDTGGRFITIAAGITELGLLDTNVGIGGTYYYIVTAVTGATESAPSVEVSATITLSSPWTQQDIGSVSATGRSVYDNATYTIRGGGSATPDGIRFMSQSVSADVDMVVRVDSKNNRTGYAGLAVRKSTSSTSAFASIEATPTDQDRIFFRRRTSDNGGTTYAVGYASLPIWLRLTRTGNSFAGFYSADGITWTTVGTGNVTMPTAVLGGVVVSGSSTNSTTAKLSNLSLTPVTNTTPMLLAGTHWWQSSPPRISLPFSEDVGASLDLSDITIQQLSSGNASITPTSLVYETTGNIATITLPTLTDGNYRLTLNSAGITDTAGAALTGTNTLDFWFLGGDFNRDRYVDSSDQTILTSNLNYTGRVLAQGDLNLNRTVNSVDQTALTSAWHLLLPTQGSVYALSSTTGADTHLLRRESASLIDHFVGADATATYRIIAGALSSTGFTANSGNDTLTLDFASGIPFVGTFALDGGANTDTLKILGASSADTINFTSTNITMNGSTITLANLEQLIFDGKLGRDIVTIASGLPVQFPTTQELASLSIANGASAIVQAGGSFVIDTNALNLNSSGKLDITNNAMIVRTTGALPSITTKILTGQNGFDSVNGQANWNGNGIVSSTARSHNVALGVDVFGVGAIRNGDLDDLNGPGSRYTTWKGRTVGAEDILIRYTYLGDADMNGTVTIDDYNLVDGTVLNLFPNKGWVSGNFDYTGSITIDDYNAIDTGYLYQAGSLGV